jgi:hypothetical protein
MQNYASYMFEAYSVKEALQVHLKNITLDLIEVESRLESKEIAYNFGPYNLAPYKIDLERSVLRQMEIEFITELLTKI